MPYEEITKDVYFKLIKNIKPLDFKNQNVLKVNDSIESDP